MVVLEFLALIKYVFGDEGLGCLATIFGATILTIILLIFAPWALYVLEIILVITLLVSLFMIISGIISLIRR